MDQSIRIDLPGWPDVMRVSKAVAMLDAIIEPEWELRYYSFNCRWSPGKQMASMRSGEGDHYFVLFTKAGAIAKGWLRDSPSGQYVVDTGRPWPGMLNAVPATLREFLVEPAFMLEDTSFCIWTETTGPGWQMGNVELPDVPDPTGLDELTFLWNVDSSRYRTWAEEYYERSLSLPAIEHIYSGNPLTSELIHALNPDCEMVSLAGDIEEIGYPVE